MFNTKIIQLNIRPATEYSFSLSVMGLKLMAIIAMAETGIMLGLEQLNITSHFWSTLLDTSTLSAITFPSFYYFIVRPITKAMRSATLLREASLQQEIDTRTHKLEAKTKMLTHQVLKILAITSAVKDAMISMDHEGLIVSWNNGATDMFGWTEAEMMGKHLHQLLAPHYRQQYEPALEHFKRTGQGPFIGNIQELTAYRKDGTEITIERSLSALEVNDDAGNRTWHSVAVIRDVTSRAENEKKLKESQQRLDLAIRGSNLGTWDWYIQTGQVVFNDAWANMLGYSHEELAPNMDTFSSRIHPEDQSHVMAALDKHMKGETEFYQATYRFRHKDGSWGWRLDSGQVFERDADGKPVRMVGTQVDITALKETEAALKEINETLEARISARTAELKTASQQMIANQKFEFMAKLSAGLNHYLKNALLMMDAQTNFLVDDLRELNGLLPQAIEALRGADADESLYRKCKELSVRALDGILKLQAHEDAMREKTLLFMGKGRSESGNKQVMDIHKELSELISLNSTTANNKGVYFTNLLDGELGQIRAHRSDLDNTIQNLINNAFDALSDAPAGRRKAITLSAFRNGNTVTIKVRDSGTGIPEAIRDKIFDPFFTTKPLELGSGVGLAEVKTIVEKNLNGTIALASNSEGTEFVITLPVQDMKKEVDPSASLDKLKEKIIKKAAEISDEKKKTFKVLVVEDEPSIRDLLLLSAKKLGLSEIDIAINGKDGFDKIMATDYDLIITDQNMPEKRGAEMIEALVQADRTDALLFLGTGDAIDGSSEGLEIKTALAAYYRKSRHNPLLGLPVYFTKGPIKTYKFFLSLALIYKEDPGFLENMTAENSSTAISSVLMSPEETKVKGKIRHDFNNW